MKARIARIVAWARATRPARVWARHTAVNGPILSQGLSWQAVFAAFAALWVGFAVAGFWLRQDAVLREWLLEAVSSSAPGLVDTGEGGAVQLRDLLAVGVLGWTGALAAIGLAWTAVGWLGSARAAVRSVTGMPTVAGNPVLQKLRDIGLTAGFGLAAVVSAAVSLGSTAALDALLDWFGADRSGPIAGIVTTGVALIVVFAFDAVVLWLFLRVAAGVRLPRRALVEGAVLGAAGLGVLKAVGGALLGGASSNPLLASFAVIIGLFIWFNLICQVILLSAAWAAETAEPRAG